jgi:hypothetical protein
LKEKLAGNGNMSFDYSCLGYMVIERNKLAFEEKGIKGDDFKGKFLVLVMVSWKRWS